MPQAKIKDFTFGKSIYGNCEIVENSNAVIYAIKTLLLTRPGNFPFTPGCGIDIGKYQFDLLDDYTIKTIQNEIVSQTSKYVPDIDNISITVKKVEDYINGELVTALGIHVMAIVNGDDVEGSFLVLKERDDLSIYDEIK